MRLATLVANEALRLAQTPSARRLLAVTDLQATQDALLRDIVRRDRDTAFGRRHQLADVHSLEDYREAVPLTRWDDLAADVDRIRAGEQHVLCGDRVRLLEPTSGSTAATKLIPWTSGLARQFRAGLHPWLHDLATSRPQLRRGRSYWSVTPAASFPQMESAVPIGFDDDADYLGPVAGRVLRTVLAVDDSVAQAATIDEFRLRTATQLLAADDLVLVSVWNPTFWLVLLDWMTDHASDVLGRLTTTRARAIGPAVRAGDWRAVWPMLDTISCWADARAAGPAAEVAERFPGVHLQPKGLLATEAMVSLPLEAAGGAVLAARSHLVEFLDDDGSALLGDELEVGHRYEVVVTTAGGLHRYRLGDVVEVTGWFGALPVLRFVGRADHVSDLVGEKLAEGFVASCLDALGVSGFAFLSPDLTPTPHYVCWVDAAPHADLADALDARLRASFHYDHARRLGQLGAVEVVELGSDADERFLAACVTRGQRMGDVKPPVLSTLTDWSDLLRQH